MPRLVIHPAGGGGSGSSDCTGQKAYFLANHGTVITVDSGDVPVEGSLPESSVLQSAGGSIPNKGASDLSASGKTVTVPSGYYPSQVSKDVAAGSATGAGSGQQSQPSISIDANGKITASVAQKTISVTPNVSPGYVASGTAGNVTLTSNSNTKQMTTQGAKTVTPSASEQTAVNSGVYTTGIVKVAGDPDLIAANIRNGKNIFNVTGNLRPGFFDYPYPPGGQATGSETCRYFDGLDYQNVSCRYYDWALSGASNINYAVVFLKSNKGLSVGRYSGGDWVFEVISFGSSDHIYEFTESDNPSKLGLVNGKLRIPYIDASSQYFDDLYIGGMLDN